MRPLYHTSYRSSGAAGPVPGAAGRLGAGGGPGELDGRTDRTPSASKERGLEEGERGKAIFLVQEIVRTFCFSKFEALRETNYICSIIESGVLLCLATHFNVFTFPLNFFFYMPEEYLSPADLFSFSYGKYYSFWLQSC